MAAEKFSQRIREMYRVVLGATIGFLPFVMFFLMREVTIDLLSAGILWALTTWVIISEWWSIEDNTSYYSINSVILNIMSMVYLILLTLLPISLIVGLDKYNNLQSYVIIFIVLSVMDIPLSFIYHQKLQDESDKKYFFGTIIFDVVLICGYLVLLFYIMPGNSVAWNAVILTGAYLIEFSCDWKLVPYLTTKISNGSNQATGINE